MSCRNLSACFLLFDAISYAAALIWWLFVLFSNPESQHDFNFKVIVCSICALVILNKFLIALAAFKLCLSGLFFSFFYLIGHFVAFLFYTVGAFLNDVECFDAFCNVKVEAFFLLIAGGELTKPVTENLFMIFNQQLGTSSLLLQSFTS